MIISTFGARFYGSTIQRIESGFIELGHILPSSTIDNALPEFPDLVYCNDIEHADEAIKEWEKLDKKPKLILSVLDLPTFLPEWPVIAPKWRSKLLLADKVTCISKTVSKDILEQFNLIADTVYNPIKPVYYIPDMPRNILCIFVGRCNAINKRKNEILWPLYKSLVPYYGDDCMHFVGNEFSGFGVNWGVVSDEKLNELYNRSVFGMICSKNEGLNLPLIEAIFTNCKPIIARDMSTADEFGIPELFCDPTPEAFFYKLKEVAENMPKYDKLCEDYTNKNKEQLTNEEKLQLLFSFVNESGYVPPEKKIYKKFTLGKWFGRQKSKIISNNCNIYKMLAINQVVKDNLDQYLINKENNKNKKVYTFDEKVQMLLDFTYTYDKIVSITEIYNEFPLGQFYFNQKRNISSQNDKIYKLFSSISPLNSTPGISFFNCSII